MKRLLFIVLLVVFGCEEQDTTPPTVTITYPGNGAVIGEIFSITCVATDNEGIEKVQLWIDGIPTDVIDETEPYIMPLDTRTYTNGSAHILTVRAFDISENKTDSDPITVVINNIYSYPQSVSISSITYDQNQLVIVWNKSTETDFSKYEVWISDQVTGNKTLINQITDINTTTYTTSDFDPAQARWYWISVTDIYEYSTFSNGYLLLDDDPTASILNDVVSVLTAILHISSRANSKHSRRAAVFCEYSSRSIPSGTSPF